MKQRRISWAGCSLANLMLGVAAGPQPDALHPPRPAAASQPSDVALPPTHVPSGAPVHAPSSAPLHLPDYLPIGSGGPVTLDAHALLLMGGKFVIVLALLLISLRLLKAVMPRGHGAGGRAAGMLLHSERVGEKGRVMLLDLHTRLVVVGNSAGTMTPLTTIEDPEEIAALRGHYRGQPAAPLRRKAHPADVAFSALLAREVGPEAQSSNQTSPTLVMAPIAQAASGRTRKLRPAARQTPHVGDQPAVAQPAAIPATGDEALAHAITAMRSLRQKVEQA